MNDGWEGAGVIAVPDAILLLAMGWGSRSNPCRARCHGEAFNGPQHGYILMETGSNEARTSRITRFVVLDCVCLVGGDDHDIADDVQI